MAYTYENVIPSLIENTDMQKRLRDGVHSTYLIIPVIGYVLHDSKRDTTDANGDIVCGYTTGTATVAATYDFISNPRELYAVPADSVPPDQIFGGGGNHEVM